MAVAFVIYIFTTSKCIYAAQAKTEDAKSAIHGRKHAPPQPLYNCQ